MRHMETLKQAKGDLLREEKLENVEISLNHLVASKLHEQNLCASCY